MLHDKIVALDFIMQKYKGWPDQESIFDYKNKNLPVVPAPV